MSNKLQNINFCAGVNATDVHIRLREFFQTRMIVQFDRASCAVVHFFIVMIELRKETNAKFKLKVARGLNGLGLFAMEPIPKGKKIIEYVGRVLTNAPDDEATSLYIFNINKHIDIDGAPRWNTARYINHSCRPNAETDTPKGHVWIKAKRNIMLGEEITYDYGKEYFNEYIKPKGCRCAKCKEKR